MKQHLLLTLSGMILSAMLCAQDASPLPSKMLIKVSPQHFIASTLQVGIEHFNTDFSKSWNFSIGLRNQGNNQNSYSDEVRGGEIDLQFRRYVRPLQQFSSRKNRTYSQGVYFGPFINGGFYTVDDLNTYTWTYRDINGQLITETSSNGGKYETQHFAAGFTIGLQRTFWEVLTLDAFVGGGLRATNFTLIAGDRNDIYNGLLDPGFTGIFPRIGFKVGIAL